MAKKPKPTDNKAENVETLVTMRLTKGDIANVLNIINAASFRGSELEPVLVLKRKFELKLKNGNC